MNALLFCRHPYSFDILKPLRDKIIGQGGKFLWYVHPEIVAEFPYCDDDFTTDVSSLKNFDSHAIFVPGNTVPNYLKGVKVQVFHGLAGEKKSHFKIRHYFDLYLTQGPYFTNRFLELKQKYRDFEVIETGWPKLDVYYSDEEVFANKRREMLETHKAEKIILYAPTFSPSLSSASELLPEIKALAENKKYLILIKFHDLMQPVWQAQYKALAAETSNIVYMDERNTIPSLRLADLMISDTSSVVYEFLLLNKPVITFRSTSENIRWEDEVNFTKLTYLVERNLQFDPYKKFREEIISDYHPYTDGNSSQRVLQAVEKYIEDNGIPKKRKLNLYRKYTVYRDFKA